MTHDSRVIAISLLQAAADNLRQDTEHKTATDIMRNCDGFDCDACKMAWESLNWVFTH